MDDEDGPRVDTNARWMWAAALGIGLIYIGSTILTPLYPIYRHIFHFSELVVTAIYAVYVVGNLGVLFFFGRLSDQIGRRPTVLIAFGVTICSALIFLFTQGTAWLFPARIINGFAAGLGAGALTAWIAELEPRGDRARTAVVASAANLAGLGSGALLAGVLAQVAPWPLHLSFAVFIVLLLVIGALLYAAPEKVSNPVRSFRRLSLRPRIGVPPEIRLAFVAPAAVAFSAFALGGFYGALSPTVLSGILKQDQPLVVGGVVALFFAAATAAAVLMQKLDGRRAMLVALGLLWAGLGLLMLAEAIRSMALLVIATLAAGPATALGYRGSLQIINQIAPDARRAEVVSSYLLVCYSANALPVIGVGLLSLIVSAPVAHRIFAIVLVVLASTACAIGLRYTRTDR